MDSVRGQATDEIGFTMDVPRTRAVLLEYSALVKEQSGLHLFFQGSPGFNPEIPVRLLVLKDDEEGGAGWSVPDCESPI